MVSQVSAYFSLSPCVPFVQASGLHCIHYRRTQDNKDAGRLPRLPTPRRLLGEGGIKETESHGSPSYKQQM